ncbi:amidohydrolase family protein [Verrucomicrobiales bacterium BCK34]|nr:amidohydrolase family protein [Verrucomicrobiales bacterium BCK34]
MNSQSRRDFLSSVTLGGGLLINEAIQAETDLSEKNWIDAHVHVWSQDRKAYPISENFADKDINPPIYSPEDLIADQKGTGVTRTLLIQMSFFEFDNSYMLDVIEGAPKQFQGVAIVDESQSDVAATMKSLLGKGVGGFRLYAFPDKVKKWDASGGIHTMWKTGSETGQAMCCLTDPASLPVIKTMCEKYRDTRVVIDHFARIGMKGEADPGQLDQLLALADFPNVYVKTSAFYALGKKAPPYTDLGPMIKQLRDAFGSERLMWASDCPYQVQGEHSYDASVDLITKKLDFLSGEDIENMMRRTAEGLFFS